MDQFTNHDLELLTSDRTGVCLSLYLRTHLTGTEILQDQTRFRNLLSRAEEELADLGMPAAKARNMIEQARRFDSDKAFWQYQSHGLAIFLTDGLFRAYRLPIEFDDLLVVSGRFHLKPLLPMISETIQYYLLALSRGGVRLFEGNRFGLEEVPLAIAKGMEEALMSDRNEAYEHYHVRSGGGASRETALFYGRGEGRDDDNDRVTRYFRTVNEEIQGFLKDKKAPLVLAGVEYLLPLYREANTYPGLLSDGVTGNFEPVRAEELHQKAWPVVESLLRKQRQEAEDEFHKLLGTGKASTFTPEIVPASYQGRVSTLLVSSRKHAWGTVDRSKAGAVSHMCKQEEQGCEDLYDFAAIQTLLKGGRVYVMDEDAVADNEPIAAVFRY